jgi:MORN repeat
MIALRGKLERTKKEPAVDSAPGATETTATPEDSYEWTWKGHWAFGLTLPDDPKKLQPFAYKWEKPVNPEDVIVVSLNFAPDDEEDDADNNETNVKSEPLEEEGPESSEQAKTTADQGEATTTPQTADADKKLDIEKTAASAAPDDKTDTVTEATTEKAPESTPATTSTVTATSSSEAKGSQEIQQGTAPSADATQSQESGATNVSTGGDGTPASTTSSPTKSKKPRITFATSLSPEDPLFTDAAEKYPEKCPAGGEWNGYFENLVKVPMKRNGKSPPAPTIVQQIQERFIIYLNVTPAKEAQTWFMTEDPGAPTPTKKSRKSPVLEPPEEDPTPLGVLKDGLVHVRGTGTNQFGTFELLGSFDLETSMLECQRMYVTPLENPRPIVRRRSRSGITLDGSARKEDGDRPYFTRKRQGSWKRKSSFGMSGDEDEDVDTSGSTRRRSYSTGGGPGAGGKRVRLAEPKAATANTAIPVEAGAPGVAVTSAAALPKLSISIPPATTSIGKRPGPSPKTATPRAKKTAGSGAAISGPKAAASASSAASSSAGSVYMKLPTVGDPKNAIWRAAHYLYYQKSDPSQEEGGPGNTNPTSSNAAAGNAYKYVVYEGELYKSHREGRGVCLYSNQMLYEGEWKKNKEHGRGTLMTADRKRIIYEGEWERGRMHGRGTFYYSSGVVLNAKQQVVLSDDSKGKKKSTSGPGNATEVGQSRYEGDFKENLRHGMGTYVLPDGSVYVGSWREGVMCGRGTFTWNDGSQYTGDWKDGKR